MSKQYIQYFFGKHTTMVIVLAAAKLPMNVEMYLVRENGLRMSNRYV